MADSAHHNLSLHPYARYTIRPETLDLMPIGTFLISCNRSGVDDPPTAAMRLVRPNNPSKYSFMQLSPGKNLLFYFWSRSGGAIKKLGQAANTKTWRWIVQPGEEGYDLLDAFKIACDHRRGQQVSTTLLCRALGIDLSHEAAIVKE